MTKVIFTGKRLSVVDHFKADKLDLVFSAKYGAGELL